MNMTAMPPFMVDYALEYAARGNRMFPCHPRGKRPLTEHGFKDATTNASVIHDWWSTGRWPDANIGVPTGERFDILDIDGPAGLDAICDATGFDDASLLATGPIVETARGWHLYFAPSGIGNRAGFLSLCDYRGRGGYVVLPPSLHATSVEYRWLELDGETYDLNRPLEPTPEWLRALLEPPAHRPVEVANGDGTRTPGFWSQFTASKSAKYATAALEDELRAVAGASVGKRNDTLNTAALKLGTLVGADHLNRSDVEAGLLAAAVTAGLGETEARGTIQSGLDAGVAQPRRVP
jgi:hypothetical protein